MLEGVTSIVHPAGIDAEASDGVVEVPAVVRGTDSEYVSQLASFSTASTIIRPDVAIGMPTAAGKSWFTAITVGASTPVVPTTGTPCVTPSASSEPVLSSCRR